MSFGVLFVLVFAGLGGPLLGAIGKGFVPVVVGELAAGLVLGSSGFGWLRPEQATTAFLASVGFAMLMFSAGMHVPLRRPGLASHISRGGSAALATGALAIACAWPIGDATSLPHRWIVAVILASGSAAIVMPSLDEFRMLSRDAALVVAAQVAVADVASLIAVPLVLEPSRVTHSIVGLLAVSACGVALFALVRALRAKAWVGRLRRLSKQRRWALDLRLALVVLFALCWLATRVGTSILIAGFAVGLVVASVGGPKRLSRQVTGVAEGFFVPLFFVVLGARIDVRALFQHVKLVELAVLLVVANVAIHVAAALATRQPLPAGLAATAQLGVPSAVVVLGLQEHVVSPGAGAAILVAALASIGISAVGVARLSRGAPAPATATRVATVT